MKVNNYEPFYRWVVISPIIKKTTKAGIILSDSDNTEKVESFRVEKVGEQCEKVKPGDRVLLERGRGLIELPFESEIPLLQVMEQQIIGKVEEDVLD